MLLGLNTVVPLMSPELLKFPKLCRLYFALLSYMLEIFPEQVGWVVVGRVVGRVGCGAVAWRFQ